MRGIALSVPMLLADGLVRIFLHHVVDLGPDFAQIFELLPSHAVPIRNTCLRTHRSLCFALYLLLHCSDQLFRHASLLSRFVEVIVAQPVLFLDRLEFAPGVALHEIVESFALGKGN